MKNERVPEHKMNFTGDVEEALDNTNADVMRNTTSRNKTVDDQANLKKE
ncbi:hypothetical protein WD019_05480 [Fictibacillus sp. Mic-4]|nr:hypothetical protein [Fictibacillus gelatini]